MNFFSIFIMEEQPSWVLNLSLEEIALRRVVINLWSEILYRHNHLQLLGCKIFDLQGYDNGLGNTTIELKEEVVNKVKYNLLKLVLPDSLKKRMLVLIRPIGSEILKWELYHLRMFKKMSSSFDVSILKQLCWTSTGVIDYRKTAERLISLEMFGIVKCYQLACEYCLVNFISLLWEKLPEGTKDCIYSESRISGFVGMQTYWARVLMGVESKLHHVTSSRYLSFYQYAFETTASQGNKTATEYFLALLTNEEREISSFRAIKFIASTRGPDTIFYILSMMTPEQKMKVLKQFSLEVLVSCLEYPWQDFFLDVADIIWTFLPTRRYDQMFCKIFANIRYLGYYFPDLFQKLFLGSPRSLKELFVNRECSVSTKSSFFREFFHNEDTETIKVVLGQLDAEDKVRLISSYNFYKLLNDVIMRNQWPLFEPAFQETLLTKEHRERLEEDYMYFSICSPDHRWKQFFDFLDKIEANTHSKRRSEGEMQSEVKKLCIEK